MAEFIGSRISLVSKSDIRYVGTLHEINSETSTVALENVSSFGTEDRKPQEEMIPPSNNVYEYIVFRGSDVKDLRIEEAPGAKENKPPLPPNDPAIMSSSGSRPPPQAHGQAQGPGQQRRTPQAHGPPQGQPPVSQAPVQNGPSFGHHPQYPPQFYAPPPAGWGRGGPPGPPFPGIPYGAPPPPGWYPPPGQGFPPPGQFPPYGYPPGPPGQQFQHGQQPPKPAPIGPGANKQDSTPTSDGDKQQEPKSLAKPAAEMAAGAVTKAPSPPVASKPLPSEAKVPSVEPSLQSTADAQTSNLTPKSASTSAKTNRVQPALPLKSPAASKAPLQSQAGNVASPAAQAPSASLRDATQAATAAVAAAMAKLPTAGQSNGSAMDNLTKKVNEMRTNEPIRAPRQPGTAAGFAPSRGGRSGRGGAARIPGQSGQKVEVPATDFDFESSNAKFSKEDLVKEAIAGSPHGENPVASPTEPDVPVTYNKSTSFFDNISSESKDRADASGGRPGGREWRGEEQKKNVETFGQGSVDNGYRGGFRGRGSRGRGRGGFRGRGGYSGNGQPGQIRGGGYRGHADVQT